MFGVGYTDVAKFYDGVFKFGVNHHEARIDQISPLGPDTALVMGKYRVTGKSPSGGAMEIAGFSTATYVRDGGRMKIRMLTALPPAS